MLIYKQYIMNKYVVEFIGTLFFIFVVISTGHWAFIGLALALGSLVGNKISDGQVVFNQAITLVLYNKKKMNSQDFWIYIVIEILAALAAFAVYESIT